jgi:hypothetical protein
VFSANSALIVSSRASAFKPFNSSFISPEIGQALVDKLHRSQLQFQQLANEHEDAVRVANRFCFFLS